MQPEPRPLPKNGTRIWLAVGVMLAIVWGVVAASSRQIFRMDELTPPSLETSGAPRPADFAWTLSDLDGQPVDFASFRGRPILLNLWATWCGPCLKEMPSIASLAASPDLKGRDLVILCVSTDRSAEALKKFVQDKGWKMTILRATSIPPAFQSEGIPATFLIAPDGKIVAAEMGAAQWDDPSVVYFLQKMAATGGR